MPHRPERFSNNAISTLALSVNAVQTQIQIDNPATFPAKAPFRLIVDNEIMRATNRTGAFVDVERGQEGTTAVSHSAGSQVAHILTKEGFLNSFEFNGVVNARLSLSNTVPVQHQGSGTQVFVTPFNGNKITLLDGVDSRFRNFPIESGIPVNLVSFGSGILVDIFSYYNDTTGQVAAEARQWLSSSARTASGELTTLEGVSVRFDDPTRRYMGTVHMTNDGFLRDVPGRRHVWNKYNQQPIELYQKHRFTTESYSSPTDRALNNDEEHRVEFVVGESGVSYAQATATIEAHTTNSANNAFVLGIGVNNSTAMTGRETGKGWGYLSTVQIQAKHADRPDKGLQKWFAVESSPNSVGVTVYGNDEDNYRNGISGFVMA